jgi:hypothetical protein
MNTRRIIISIVLAGCFVATPFMMNQACGYGYYWCSNNGNKVVWTGKAITLRAAKSTFPSGSSWRTALSTCNSRWNAAPGRFTFGVSWNEKYMSRGNGQNEIWATDRNIFDGAPAFCYRRARCVGQTAKWLEKDIVYDADLSWSNSTTRSAKRAYSSTGARDFRTATLHEQGHALGIYHENDTYNIMGTDETHVNANSNTLYHYAGEDAGNGEVFLYGQTQNSKKNDVGVVHWEYSGSSGEYSTHNRTELYTASGGTWVSSPTFNGVEYYRVKAGNDYQVEFTFENNGYYAKNGVNVRWYMSKNNNITTNDTVLRTGTMNLARNVVYTAKHTITIPGSLSVGAVRWLGVIVDYNNTISEFTGNNNATYLQVPIRVVP